VAVAETDGPAAALDLVDRLDLGDYRHRALAVATDDAERRLLARRLAELDGTGHGLI
jgi:hypothetical protein